MVIDISTQFIDESSHLEAILPGRHVQASNVGEAPELAVVMVPQEAEYWHHSFRTDEDLKFVPGGQLHLLDVLGHALRHVLSEVDHVLPLHGVKLPHGGCTRREQVRPILKPEFTRKRAPGLLRLVSVTEASGTAPAAPLLLPSCRTKMDGKTPETRMTKLASMISYLKNQRQKGHRLKNGVRT